MRSSVARSSGCCENSRAARRLWMAVITSMVGHAPRVGGRRRAGSGGAAGHQAPRARDELATAVRAGGVHLIAAAGAERALVAADAGIAVRRERRGAALAGGAHLERHQR